MTNHVEENRRHAFIALGSNKGDRARAIRGAIHAIASLPHTSIDQLSTVHETAPVGPIDQGPFLNAVLSCHTALAPRDLLVSLNAIERDLGRDRTSEQRWGPRTLDLDILLYEGHTVDEPGLTIPHPRLHERRFVLAPLAEIAPALVVPGIGRTVRDLLEALPSESESA